MRNRVLEFAFGALLFSMFGLCTEIVFTGLWSGWGDSFLGRVSLLMVPVYTVAYALLVFVLPALERRGLGRVAVRLPLTVLVIYIIEWGAGATYAAIGLTPWHYDHGWASSWSSGHVTLYYLPAWFIFAWLVVPVGRFVQEITASQRLRTNATQSAAESAGLQR